MAQAGPGCSLTAAHGAGLEGMQSSAGLSRCVWRKILTRGTSRRGNAMNCPIEILKEEKKGMHLGLTGEQSFRPRPQDGSRWPVALATTARALERRAGRLCNLRQQRICFLVSLGNLFTIQKFSGVHLSLWGSLLLKSHFGGIASAFTSTFSCLLPEYRAIGRCARLSPYKIQEKFRF